MSLPLSSSSHATPERVSPSAQTKRSNSPQPLLSNSHINSITVGHAQHPIPPQSSPPLSGYRASVTGVKTMPTPSQMQMFQQQQQQQQQQSNLAGMHKMPMAKMKMIIGKMPISPHQPMPFKLTPSATASLLSSSSSVGLPNKMMMLPPPPQPLSSSQLSSSAILLASSQLPRPAPSISARSTSPTLSAKMALTPNSYYPPGTFTKSMMHTPQAIPGAKVKMMMNATNMNMNKNKMRMNAPVPPHSMSLLSSTISEAGSLTSEREGVPSLHPVKLPANMYNLNNNNNNNNNNNKKMMMMPLPMPMPANGPTSINHDQALKLQSSSSITSSEQHLPQEHDEDTSHKTHLESKKEMNSSNSPIKPTPLSSEFKSTTYNATNGNTKANEQTLQSLSTSSTLPSPPLATLALQQKSAESLPSEYVMHNAMQDVLRVMNTNDDDHLIHLNKGKFTDNSIGAADQGGFVETGNSKENFVLSGLDNAGQSREDVIVVPAQPSLTDNVVEAGVDANMQSVKQKTKIFVETENAPSARGKKTRFSHLVFGGSSDEDSSDEDKRDIVQMQTSKKKEDMKLSNADMDSNDAANRVKEKKDQATIIVAQNNNAARATSEETAAVTSLVPSHATQDAQITNNYDSVLDKLFESERDKPHDDIKQDIPSYEHNLLGINANDAPHSVNDENNNKSMSRSDTLDDKHDNYSHTQVQRDRADSNEFPQVSTLTSVSSPALHDLTLTSSPAPPPITSSSFVPIYGQEHNKEEEEQQQKEQHKKENVHAHAPNTARANPKAKAAIMNTKGRTSFARNDKNKDSTPSPWITSTAKATTSQSKSSARAAPQAVSKVESAKIRMPTRNKHTESTQMPSKVDKLKNQKRISSLASHEVNDQGEVDNKESLQANIEERQELTSDVAENHVSPDKQNKEAREQASANDDNDRESNASRESEEKRFDSVDGSMLDGSDDMESYVDSYSYNTENRKLAREMYRFYHTLKAQEARREGRETAWKDKDKSRQDYRLAERTSPCRMRRSQRWSSPFANSLDANDKEREQQHHEHEHEHLHHSFLHGVRMSTPAAISSSTIHNNNINCCRNNKKSISALGQQHSERKITTPVTRRSARPCSVDRITGLQQQHPPPSSSSSPFFTVSYSSPRRVEQARSPWRYNSKFTHDLSSRPLSPWRRPLGIIVHSSIPPNKTIARAITVSSRKPIRSHSMSDISSMSSTLSSSRLLSERGTKRQGKSSEEEELSEQKSNNHTKENRNERINTINTSKGDYVMRQRARSVDDNEWHTKQNNSSKTHAINSSSAREASHPYCVMKSFPPHTHVPHTHRESYSINSFMENQKEKTQDKVYISPTCTRLQERLPVHRSGKIKNQIQHKDNSHFNFDKDSHVKKMDSANDYDLCDESEVISLNSNMRSTASDRRANDDNDNFYKSIKGETSNKNNKRKQKKSLQTQELEEHKNEKHSNNSIINKAKSGNATNEQVLARKALGKPSSFIGTRVLSQNDNNEWLPSERPKSTRVLTRSVESKERTQSSLPCHTLRKDDNPVHVRTERGERKITSASCKAWVDDILANVREKIGKERTTLPSSSSVTHKNNNINYNNNNSVENGLNTNNKEISMMRTMNREREPTIPLIDLRYEFKPKINDSNDPFAINENENENINNNNNINSSRSRRIGKKNTSKANTTRSPMSYVHPTRSSPRQYHGRNSPFHEPHSHSTSTHSLISTTSETAALHNDHQSHYHSLSEINHHGESSNKGRSHSASPLKTIVIDAPELLPLSFYSTIKVKNPQMPSAWARAPPREKYSVLPGTAAARRVIRARSINELAPDDNIQCVNGINGYTEELREPNKNNNNNNNNMYSTLLSPSLLSPPIVHANEINYVATRNENTNNVERQLISPTRDGDDIGTNYHNVMTMQAQTTSQSVASPLIPPPSPNHFLVEEVHLDEHHKPYVVIKQIPKGQAAQAQREASARLAMPRPMYVKLNNDNINNNDSCTSNTKSVHEKMRDSWKS